MIIASMYTSSNNNIPNQGHCPPGNRKNIVKNTANKYSGSIIIITIVDLTNMYINHILIENVSNTIKSQHLNIAIK